MKDDYIQRVVDGKTFVDVGPLWESQNEKLSVASRHGATSVTAIDQFPEEHDLWVSFRQRMNLLGIPCQCFACDVCHYQGPPFDVVYCAGVLYHHPSPITLLKKLSSICNNHMILSTVVTENRILNAEGFVEMIPGSCVFLPAVPPEDLRVLHKDWETFLGGRQGDAMAQDVRNWSPDNLYHWWWLFTIEAVISMCNVVGFKVIEKHYEGRLLTLLLERRNAEDLTDSECFLCITVSEDEIHL